MGGDSIASATLADGRTLWLFGDSFIGEPDAQDRRGATLIDNSLAVSTCSSGEFAIAYEWLGTRDAPMAIFDDDDPQTRLWPLAARAEDGIVHVFVTIVTVIDDSALGFETKGAALVDLTIDDGPPSQWKQHWTALDIPAGLVGGTILDGSGPLRFAVAREDEPFEVHMFEMDESGSLSDSDTIFKGGVSEMSLIEGADGSWRLTQTRAGMFSPDVIMRAAPSLNGPWTDPETVYRFPEMQPGNPHYRKDAFCYAAKEHPALAPPGAALLTYACNTGDTDALERDMTLYRPRVVVLPDP